MGSRISGLELLAPAGGPSAGHAALDYGADAIYLGLDKFSARAEAENFSIEELSEMVAFAHSLNPRRKVFVTLNTVIFEDELGEVVDMLYSLSELEVDGVIVQDLGIAEIIQKYFPKLKMHASTQMAIHNLEGVRLIEKMGFSRVILARELTFEEIKDLAEKSKIETEVFIHGALCYSYSGLCLFSSLILGRSGNRGQCAYPCREFFKSSESNLKGLPFSMKDLSLSSAIEELKISGVSSLKIEGRKKSPLYVAAVVNYYRHLLDGKLSEEEIKKYESDIKKVFSRPWTELYFRSRQNRIVVNSETTGHQGILIGRVEKFMKSRGKRDRIQFKSSEGLEKRDGLNIEIEGWEKYYGFSVEFSDRSFTSQANSSIELVLPKKHPKIKVGDRIYYASSQEVKRNYNDLSAPGKLRVRKTLDFDLNVSETSYTLKGHVQPKGGAEKIESEFIERGSLVKSSNPEINSEVTKALEKLGSTRLKLGSLNIENQGLFFIPVSKINEARRIVVSDLEKKLKAYRSGRISEIKNKITQLNPENEKSIRPGVSWSLKVDYSGYLDLFTESEFGKLREVVIEISNEEIRILKDNLEKLGRFIGRDRIRLALPAITRSWEAEDLKKKINSLISLGYTNWEISNLSGIEFLDFPEYRGMLNISSNFHLYVLNHLAAEKLFSLGISKVVLSPENSLDNMKKLIPFLGIRAEYIAYQDTPLFISESCPHANLTQKCIGKPECNFKSISLESEKLGNFKIVSKDCRTVVIRSNPFDNSSKVNELIQAGVKNFRLDFINREYSSGEVMKILNSILK